MQAIVRAPKDEIEATPLPIVHISLNLWPCKVFGKKYPGLHIFCVDRQLNFRNALLRVRLDCHRQIFMSHSHVYNLWDKLIVALKWKDSAHDFIHFLDM